MHTTATMRENTKLWGIEENVVVTQRVRRKHNRKGGKGKTVAMTMGKGGDGSCFGAAAQKLVAMTTGESCLAQGEYKTVAMSIGREVKARQLQ